MRYFSCSYLSLAIATVLISGCNGNSSSSESEPNLEAKSISGVAISGHEYFSNAFVCIDINNNSLCDSNEPSTIATSEGEFSFSLNEGDYHDAIESGYLLASESDGKLKSKSYSPTLVGIIDVGLVVISPISTIVFNTAEQSNVLNANNRNIEIEKAKRLVVDQLGLKNTSAGELLSDYIESRQEELTELASKVQKDLIRAEVIQAEAQKKYGDDWQDIKGYAGFVFESDYQTGESMLYQLESITLSKQDSHGNVVERQLGNKWRTDVQAEDSKGVFSDFYDHTDYWHRDGTLVQEVYWARNPFALERLEECGSCYNENGDVVTLKGEKYSWGTWNFANGTDGYRDIDVSEVYNEGDLAEVPEHYKTNWVRSYDSDCDLESQESKFNQDQIVLDACIDFVQTREISESAIADVHKQIDVLYHWDTIAPEGSVLNLEKPNYHEVRADTIDSIGNYTNIRQQDWNADGSFNATTTTSVTLNSDLSEVKQTSLAQPVWPTVDEAREYGAYNYGGKRGLTYWLELTESETKFADNTLSGLHSKYHLYVLDEKLEMPYLDDSEKPVMFAHFETVPHRVGNTMMLSSKWEHHFVDLVLNEIDFAEYTRDDIGQNVVLSEGVGKDEQAYRYSEYDTQHEDLTQLVIEALEQGAQAGKLSKYLPGTLTEVDRTVLGQSITSKDWYWVLEDARGNLIYFEHAPGKYQAFEKVSLESDKASNLWVHNISGELMRFKDFNENSTCTWWTCFELQQIKPIDKQELTPQTERWIADVEIVVGNDSREHYVGYLFSTQQAAENFAANHSMR